MQTLTAERCLEWLRGGSLRGLWGKGAIWRAPFLIVQMRIRKRIKNNLRNYRQSPQKIIENILDMCYDFFITVKGI